MEGEAVERKERGEEQRQEEREKWRWGEEKRGRICREQEQREGGEHERWGESWTQEPGEGSLPPLPILVTSPKDRLN